MLAKKKILVLTDWYEPGYKAGGPIQSCKNFVSALHDVFELVLITSDRDQGDTGPYPGIATDTWIRHDPGFRIFYAGPATFRSNGLKRLIASEAPDYIYLNSMYSFQFTILPLWWKKRKQIGAGIVIAPRGMLHEGAIRFKSGKKTLFIRMLNTLGLPRQLTFQATDEQECRDIIRYFPSAGKVQLVPNFTRNEEVGWKSVEKRPGQLDCVFISRLAPKKNLLFLLNVLQALPDTLRLRLDLYGELEDRDYWEKCKAVIDRLPSHVSVDWKGPISNDKVTATLQEYHVFVLPTLGENFGHAIFEALLAGKPVLISDKTPWLGLEQQQAGFDLPLQPRRFEQTLLQLAGMDQAAYDQWSVAAFEYGRKKRSSDQLKEKYKELFL